MNALPVLAGVAIGLVQGLIGGGGSVLGVPALIYVVGLGDPHVAIGTSALAVAISALAIGVSTRCDDCIAFHAKAAVDHGATRDEVMETLGMAIYMGAGPSAMYASHALAAFNQFSAAKAA